MKALGIEGDTPRDTVATLVAQVKQLRTELQTALTDNKSQREENQRLRQRENAIDQRINRRSNPSAPTCAGPEQAASARQQTEGCSPTCSGAWTASAARRRPCRSARGPGAAGGDEAGMEGGVRWVEPDDAKPAEGRNGSRGAGGGMSFPTSFGPAQSTLETTAETVANAGARAAGVKSAKPVYTVPTNSTLMGSVAMTALIGRVPIDGTVNDPYPFKVLVGPDNLTANGIDIPDVAGAVFSGTASGDWTLSCVRGQVRSITFVFHDGTIRTIPEDREGNQQNNQQRDGLGWISDPYGIPCVSGERRSNAQQYLGSQALITAAGAGVASLIEATAAACPMSAQTAPSAPWASAARKRSARFSRAACGTCRPGSTSSTARPSPPSMCSPAPRSPSTSKSRSPSTSTRRPQGRSPRRRKPCSRT
jgi:integrating conjugative element protein (TIGR03752 family)